MTDTRVKFWCLTLNNPTELIQPPEHCTYLIYQAEIGENGTLHYQGYVEFSERKRLTQLKKWLPGGHFEPRRGSQEEAINYCKKEDSRIENSLPVEWGTPTIIQKGQRTDLIKVFQDIKNGKSEVEIANQHPEEWCRYYRAFARYRSLQTPKRNWKTEVVVLIGPPGCGKSQHCLNSCPTETQYWKQRSQWWDEYEGQETVVMDDFYGWIPWDVLLRICDRYPLLVETKGGQQQFIAKTIYITSNQDPEQWYKDPPNFQALIRRVSKWIIWTKGNLKLETNTYNDIKTLLN